MSDLERTMTPCPPAEELAAFCWRRVSDAARAAMLVHLSQCVTCRTQAARMMADAQSDEGSPPPGASR